ncbi:MAG: hypothetical protein WCO61_09285 [Alphaproteobacteria bacterium]
MPLNLITGTIGFINTSADVNKGSNLEFIDGIKRTIQSNEKVKFSVPNGTAELGRIIDLIKSPTNKGQTPQPVLHITSGKALPLNGQTQRVFRVTLGDLAPAAVTLIIGAEITNPPR